MHLERQTDGLCYNELCANAQTTQSGTHIATRTDELRRAVVHELDTHTGGEDTVVQAAFELHHDRHSDYTFCAEGGNIAAQADELRHIDTHTEELRSSRYADELRDCPHSDVAHTVSGDHELPRTGTTELAPPTNPALSVASALGWEDMEFPLKVEASDSCVCRREPHAYKVTMEIHELRMPCSYSGDADSVMNESLVPQVKNWQWKGKGHTQPWYNLRVKQQGTFYNDRTVMTCRSCRLSPATIVATQADELPRLV